MGTYVAEDNSSKALHWEEEELIENFKNVGLKSEEHEEGGYGDLDHTGSHPLRPYADDCPHYLRTGTCKFGLSCRYNHPVKRTNLGGRVKEREGNFDNKPEGQIECKYYLTAEGCKYGESCRYSHYKDKSETLAAPELNFLGLPIRMGEKDCPFYMRHGSCGYGARCIFHHPEANSFGGSNPPNSAFDHKSAGQQDYSPGISNGESAPFQRSRESQPDQTSWSSRMPYRLEGYQVPGEPQGKNGNNSSTPAPPSSFVGIGAASLQDEGFPERPGQPECDYFLKTGDCKYRATCRYHHPKDAFPRREPCILSDKGLPLRPGKSVCRHYSRFGICKFGRACLFDHPPEMAALADWSPSDPAQTHGTGYWDN